MHGADAVEAIVFVDAGGKLCGIATGAQTNIMGEETEEVEI